jgi:preprotein translocase subunit SecE
MSRLADIQRFMREVKVETKKVVWPDRKETVQATLMVFIMVVVVSIFLWIVDTALGVVVQKVIS